MRTIEKIYLRAFTVRIQDQRTGEAKEDVIVFSKHQLQAAQIIGQSSKELICRAYNAQGYTVLDIGKADKVEADLDLYGLYREAVDTRPRLQELRSRLSVKLIFSPTSACITRFRASITAACSRVTGSRGEKVFSEVPVMYPAV